MRLLYKLTAISIFFLAGCGGSGPTAEKPNANLIGTSEDGLKVVEGMPSEYVEAVKVYENRLQEGMDIPDNVFEAVIPLTKAWEYNSFPLNVCFFNGYDELNQRVMNAAKQWDSSNNRISFDFGEDTVPQQCDDSKVYHIRISYNWSGYWSAVGSDSARVFSQNQSSMNFGGWDLWAVAPSDETLIATVQHEFGHALAFEHEHQHPLDDCESEFDWPAIYERLASPPNSWPKDKVDFNMRKLNSEDRIMFGQFDPESIMLYQFPVDFYKSGADSKCYTPDENSNASPLDLVMASIVYPKDEGEFVANQAERDEDISAYVQNAFGTAFSMQSFRSLNQTPNGMEGNPFE